MPTALKYRVQWPPCCKRVSRSAADHGRIRKAHGRRMVGGCARRPACSYRRGPTTEYYRLGDEPRATILVACSKCDWRAAFDRDELIASHGADYPVPNLLGHVVAPGCSRVRSYWDRCVRTTLPDWMNAQQASLLSGAACVGAALSRPAGP
jgi:hypothetical protein